MNKKILLLFLIPVLIGAYFLTRPSLVIDVTPAFYAPVVATVYATGVVESREKADLSPLITARITKFNVVEGDKVSKDQVLVEFDDAEERAHVASLEAQLKFQEIDLKRQIELTKNKFSSEQAMESSTSQVDKLKADLEAAKTRLAEHQLKSPQEGIVLKKDGDVGEVIQPGKVLMSIGQPDNIYIEAEVDEEGLPEVKKGQQVLIKADAFPGEHYEGSVEDITPLGNSLNKNYRIYVQFKDKPPFSVNMSVDCNIMTQQKEKALLVPATAVKDNKIWLVKSGKLAQQNVKIGIRGDRFLEVLEGVAVDDEVATKYSDQWQQGESVRTREKLMSIESAPK